MADSFLFSLILVFAAGLGALIFLVSKVSEKLNQQSGLNSQQAQEIEKIKQVIDSQLKEIRETANGTSQQMMDQVRSFTQEATELKKDLENIQTKVGDLSSFQEIFKSPKLRGQWGEASLNHILSQYFSPEMYQVQHLFSNGEQVDAVLKLPNGKLLPIDAKFPSDNFEKMVEAREDAEKELYRQSFISDVKQKIKEISSKYIRPAEGTIDYALMYIPAEAIYYEMVVRGEANIAQYARSQKIGLTSPNNFYLTLHSIADWFRDAQFSKNTQQVLKRLERVSSDSQKLTDDFRKLGRHLQDASSAYDRSEKRLSLLDDRVKGLIEADETEEKQLAKGD